MNLQQHVLEWLDSIGADGLMYPDTGTHKHCWSAEDALKMLCVDAHMMVPAYRHADGSYYTEADKSHRADDLGIKESPK